MLGFLREFFGGVKKHKSSPEPCRQADEEWYADPLTGKKMIRKRQDSVSSPAVEEEPSLAMNVVESLFGAITDAIGFLISAENNEEESNRLTPRETDSPNNQTTTLPKDYDANKNQYNAGNGGDDRNHQSVQYDTLVDCRSDKSNSGVGGEWVAGVTRVAPDTA